ncbi:MAG: hypothetical protein KGS10_05520 [Chloroflexi bacterium]|nr:hypothetical protein [Chloroflexota bacterium]
MSITALADRRVTVYRRTQYVIDATPAAPAMGLSRQPGARACLQVVVSGTSPCTGTVTISGLIGGSPIVTVLTFSYPDTQTTVAQYDSISLVTTAGLADESPLPTIAIQAMGRDGSAVHASYVLVSDWPMRKDAGSPSWPAPIPGAAEMERCLWYFDYTDAWIPRDGDVFVDQRTGEQWLVVGHPAQHGGGLTVPHHFEVTCMRRQGSSTT